jgi:hypothetical protein
MAATARNVWLWPGLLTSCVGVLLAGCVSISPMQPNIIHGGRAVGVSIAPDDPRRSVVASETGGIFISADSGITWSHTSANTTLRYTDVKHLPASPGVVIASATADTLTSNGGGIWRSTDGGASWSRVALATPVPACEAGLTANGLEAESTRSRAWAATSCGVAYSDDAGASWTFLPAAPGYAHDAAYAVVAPTTTHIIILTDAGVKVSTDAGATWSVSNAGIPAFVHGRGANHLAVSPFNPAHIFWTLTYILTDPDASAWEFHVALFGSWDGGATWNAIVDEPLITRPPFVRTTRPLDANRFILHYGNGACGLRYATVTDGTVPALSGWVEPTFDHCDTSDMAFSPIDGITPLLLTTDGGVHRSVDGGATWTTTGGGAGGYNAFQVLEVTGQLHADRLDSDLYFATWDNSILASPDGGVTWPNWICCEGFYLNVWRQPLPPAETKVTGVNCGPCRNFITDPLLTGYTIFPTPPNAIGGPRLLRPGAYLFNTMLPGLPASVFNLSTDTGASWTPRYGFPESVRDLPDVAGTVSNPVTYTAVKRSGATADGSEIVGIKRVAGTLGSGSPLVSDVGGLGGLGGFATVAPWYYPIGVDPGDSNFLIVPDIVDQTVKISADAGATWRTDATLNSLVTQGGLFRFNVGAGSQISAIGFDPDCPGHALVGTVQAGLVETFDRGGSWSAVPLSSQIPFISDFFFKGSGKAVISSYGRGLWTHSYVCPNSYVRPPGRAPQLGVPLIYWMGAAVPLGQIRNPEVCPRCGYFTVPGGEIIDVAFDRATGAVREVVLSGGTIKGLTYQRTPVQAPFQVGQGTQVGDFSGDQDILAQIKAGAHIKGLYLDGSILKGYILASREVADDELPRTAPLGPYVTVEVRRGTGQAEDAALSVLVRGTGFDPRRPILLSVDGRAVQLATPPRFDQNGNFILTLPPVVGRGQHTLLVEQRGGGATLRDAANFTIARVDKPQEQERAPVRP